MTVDVREDKNRSNVQENVKIQSRQTASQHRIVISSEKFAKTK